MDDEKWQCPWCRQVAMEQLERCISDARHCACGAVIIGAPSGDQDEVTDDALNHFAITINPSSRGYDTLIRKDMENAGIEIRQGPTDENSNHPWGWPTIYTWFKLRADKQAPL